TSKERIKKQLTELWRYTQKVAREEMEDDTPPDFTEIDKDKVKQTIETVLDPYFLEGFFFRV
ncbi:MAG TPA: hypothetical protein VEV15_14350, partial [Flavisolibacter sp.]|nr:hypothetical protein [Flavisolibacter sp.]